MASEFAARIERAGDAPFGDRLIEFVLGNPDDEAALTDAVGLLARWLAPDDRPPTAGAAARLWQACLWAVDRIHGSGVYPLGRLRFLDDDLLAGLVEEASARQPRRMPAGRRVIGAAGDVLSAMALGRQLREAVSRVLGFAVVPTGDALYEYDGAGSRVHPHLDARGYECVCHIVLAQTGSNKPAVSTLVAHRADRGLPVRLAIRPGEAVVIRGRGTVHSWKRLGSREQRTLVAIGFERRLRGCRGLGWRPGPP